MRIISRHPGGFRPRTSGIYGHLPKFAGCRRYDPEQPQSLWSDDGWQEFVEEWNAAHASCRWPRKHLSYVGYVRLVTDTYNYTIWYMGNPYRHKIFERTAMHRITLREKP